MTVTERAAYMKAYRKEHRERIEETRRAWRERKTGKWIVKQRGHATDVCCSVCKEIRFNDYSWGFTAEVIQAEVDCDEQMPKFCENCGAKMEVCE